MKVSDQLVASTATLDPPPEPTELPETSEPAPATAAAPSAPAPRRGQSRRRRSVQAPTLVGLSATEAIAALREADLNPAVEHLDTDAADEHGYTLAQDPAPAEDLARGATVSIWIGALIDEDTGDEETDDRPDAARHLAFDPDEPSGDQAPLAFDHVGDDVPRPTDHSAEELDPSTDAPASELPTSVAAHATERRPHVYTDACAPGDPLDDEFLPVGESAVGVVHRHRSVRRRIALPLAGLLGGLALWLLTAVLGRSSTAPLPAPTPSAASVRSVRAMPQSATTGRTGHLTTLPPGRRSAPRSRRQTHAGPVRHATARRVRRVTRLASRPAPATAQQMPPAVPVAAPAAPAPPATPPSPAPHRPTSDPVRREFGGP